MSRGILKDNRGLTLIEILIAIGILSIVLLSIYGTFFSVQKAIDMTDGEMTRFREVRIFFDLIKREVESAYLFTGGEDDGGTFFQVKDRDIYGKRMSELYFTSFAPYGHGLYSIGYELDAEKKILYKTASPAWPVSKEPEKIEVLDGVEEFQVEIKSSGKWIGTYDTKLSRKLPEEVRITLKFKDKGKELVFEERMEPKLR